MSEALAADRMSREQDRQITDAIAREQTRLRNFIRARVPDRADAEDLLQDVFCELVEAYRLLKPVNEVGAWMFRVARNRIIDSFRKKKPAALDDQLAGGEEGQRVLEEWLPSGDAGPEALYARGVLMDEIEDALGELPAEQRRVFIAHEFDGVSFKQLAAETGLSINTLLARKRYAVLHLRRRLGEAAGEFMEGQKGL